MSVEESRLQISVIIPGEAPGPIHWSRYTAFRVIPEWIPQWKFLFEKRIGGQGPTCCIDGKEELPLKLYRVVYSILEVVTDKLNIDK